MKKLAMAMAVVFLYGMAGVVKGQESKPGSNPIVLSGDKPNPDGGGNGSKEGNAAFNPQPDPPGDKGSADNPTAVEKGGNQIRKAGEKNGLNASGKAGLTLNKSSKTSKLKNSGKGVTNNLKTSQINGGTKGSINGSGKTSLNNSNNAGLNFTHGANSALSGNTHNGAMGDGSVKGAAGQ